MSEQQVKANVSQEITVNIKITVNNRDYVLLIPSGVPYEEAYVVALEMGSVIKSMQAQANEFAAQQLEKEKESDGKE